MSTIHDVAGRAEVSSATVSRYLNNSGYVGKKTRVRIEQAIDEMQYVPNSLARSLHSKTTHTLGLLLPDIVNAFWTGVARGVEDEAREWGFNVILCNTDSDLTKQKDYISILLQKQVDGLVYVPLSRESHASLENLLQVERHGVPFVVLDAPVEGIAADTVLVDSRRAARELIHYVIDCGHKRIAFLTGHKGHFTAEERLTGCFEALAEAGIQPDPDLIYYTTYDEPGGYQMASRLLKVIPLPTAIFTGNNMIALGTIKALREAGLRVPQDISLVCFDDIPQASLIDPFLTVASQPAYEIGQCGTRMLLQRISGQAPAEPQTVVLPAEIIVRKSCAVLKL